MPKPNPTPTTAPACGVALHWKRMSCPEQRYQPLRVVLIGTDFEVRVWETLLKIPMGRATTYSDVACKIAKPKASRAVGAAVGVAAVCLLRRRSAGGERDGLEAGHILAADDDEARLLGVDAALVLDQVLHRLERLRVGGEDRDLLVLAVRARDGGQVHERGHENGLLRRRARESLEPHHEAAVARDYPVVFGTLFIFSLIGLVIGLISDLMYVWIDPRIDFESRLS